MKRLRFQRILGMMIVLVFVFLLVSYAQSPSSKTIRIGVNLELSGSVAQFGQRHLE
ncbi:hypothetical protein OTJ99_002113 [Caldicellulosiruptor naganoensis]|uniref:Uncharacterized protein n=1 Tax=Caldicellulosiruptor naganoensis TaxID=29324 RepID=A0ABY7BEM5_9FIRM|nr:hypothetical protein OTJ99_002113 [Caldicellulosiruptor naganoensis]